jgi:hypothetical protein
VSGLPDAQGHFGRYGGRFVPETLMAPLIELEKAYAAAQRDRKFQRRLHGLLADYAGRPTPLYFAARLTEHCGGAAIWLKREDLCHTGAHKINNVLGQALLAAKMGKHRVIAETGAGQHGVATATAAALLGLECEVYMGAEDVERPRDPGGRRQPHAQGRDQRSPARLGDQRPHHVLPARLGAGPASLSNDGARLSRGDRPRGAAPGSARAGPVA